MMIIASLAKIVTIDVENIRGISNCVEMKDFRGRIQKIEFSLTFSIS